jgi:hypothetical protein
MAHIIVPYLPTWLCLEHISEVKLFLGLFLGLLTLVGGIIILIIFFVMKETPEYRAQMHWIYAG